MDFETWLNQCPDPSRFAVEYVDIRSDIQNVIDTYDRPEWKKINFNTVSYTHLTLPTKA